MILNNNQLAIITVKNIKSTDGQAIDLVESSFVTKLTPMYSTPLKVREVAGAFIADISDDILNQLILKYSIEADMLATCDTVTWEKWEFYTTKWATLKVAIDAIYNSDMYIINSNKGKSYKKLGDFSISQDMKTSDPIDYIKKFLTKLECEVFKLNVSVRMCKEPLLECDADMLDDIASMYGVPAKTVIKGGAVPGRPMFGRTFTQMGQHPQWTGWLQQNNRKSLTNYVNHSATSHRTSKGPEGV